MSVINQVLLDLEKRRASAAERALLPNHVRALPQSDRGPPWGWIAAAATAVALLGGVGLLAPELDGLSGRRGDAPGPAVAHPGAEAAIERVVRASAGVTGEADAAGAGTEHAVIAPASRLSLELSRVPQTASTQAAPLLPAARVLGREEAPGPAPSPEPPAARREPPAKPESHKAPAAATPEPEIRKQVREPSPRELAENEYRKATAQLHQGKLAEALEGLRAALELFPGHHGARQALVGGLLQAKQPAEAERVLQEGLKLAPGQIGFAMMLARLQVERGEEAQAIATLQRSLDSARGSADYLAFLAALLQRQGRHDEAIRQYQAALGLKPAAVWLLGLGISLQALDRRAEAREAYRAALAADGLGAELAAFAEQRLRQLQ
jgi:MSHA biogenesis protein MshN